MSRSAIHADEHKASVGAFKPSRPLHLIDLTGVLETPSLFDGSVSHLREKVLLLREFAGAIAERCYTAPSGLG